LDVDRGRDGLGDGEVPRLVEDHHRRPAFGRGFAMRVAPRLCPEVFVERGVATGVAQLNAAVKDVSRAVEGDALFGSDVDSGR